MVEQRYDAVREVLDGATVKETAIRYGVDRTSRPLKMAFSFITARDPLPTDPLLTGVSAPAFLPALEVLVD
jgi:hypothetical protein